MDKNAPENQALHVNWNPNEKLHNRNSCKTSGFETPDKRFHLQRREREEYNTPPDWHMPIIMSEKKQIHEMSDTGMGSMKQFIGSSVCFR